MNRSSAVAAAIACAIASLGQPAAWAADPPTPAAAQEAAQAPVSADKPAEVLKTKTRSNQSNDRVSAAPAAEDEADKAESAAAIKTKTKSNQSND